MQYVQVITFSNSKQKTLKTNLIVSKVCVCKKRDNYIFSIYLFNLQENIERHYTKNIRGIVSTDEGNDSSKPAQSGNQRFKLFWINKGQQKFNDV